VVVTRSSGGSSLAQLYDTLGTAIASNAELEGGSIHLVHEMGQVLFSEGLQLTIRRIEALTIAQSTAFDVVLTDLPGVPYRIFEVLVFAGEGDDAADISNCAVMLRDPISGREQPFFSWENDNASTVRFSPDSTIGVINASVLNKDTRVNQVGGLPLIGQGGQKATGPADIAMRGTTGAFGAGSIDILCNLLIASSDTPGGIRSEGLPIPSW